MIRTPLFANPKGFHHLVKAFLTSYIELILHSSHAVHALMNSIAKSVLSLRFAVHKPNSCSFLSKGKCTMRMALNLPQDSYCYLLISSLKPGTVNCWSHFSYSKQQAGIALNSCSYNGGKCNCVCSSSHVNPAKNEQSTPVE